MLDKDRALVVYRPILRFWKSVWQGSHIDLGKDVSDRIWRESTQMDKIIGWIIEERVGLEIKGQFSKWIKVVRGDGGVPHFIIFINYIDNGIVSKNLKSEDIRNYARNSDRGRCRLNEERPKKNLWMGQRQTDTAKCSSTFKMTREPCNISLID